MSDDEDPLWTDILSHITAAGRPMRPTDVEKAFSERNGSYVRKVLSKLVERGSLVRPSRGLYDLPGRTAQTRDTSRERDAEVTEGVQRLPGLAAPSDLVLSLKERVTITLYTEVCAGDGVIVFDQASEISVTLSPALAFHFFGFQPPEVMGVSQVVGDSMEPLLYDGDLVLYELTPDVNGGGVFVLNYNGLAACKRVQQQGRGYRLIPENRQAGYEPELIRATGDGYVHDATGDEIEFGVVGRVVFPRPETPRLHIQQVQTLLTNMFREAAFDRAA